MNLSMVKACFWCNRDTGPVSSLWHQALAMPLWLLLLGAHPPCVTQKKRAIGDRRSCLAIQLCCARKVRGAPSPKCTPRAARTCEGLKPAGSGLSQKAETSADQLLDQLCTSWCMGGSHCAYDKKASTQVFACDSLRA